ncbi:MAG: hypothetical protein N3A61_01860, partial [Ignavibacteria bacterium]|nr:hypothetical protein [Ignavibacteria bacterium]
GYKKLKTENLYLTSKNPQLLEILSKSKTSKQILILPLPFLNKQKTNRVFVIHKGKIINYYDKIHLFKPQNEPAYFSAGNKICICEVKIRDKLIRFGIVICFDLRFPELIRLLALQGIQILFVPARWPKVRGDAWKTLLKARAIENHIFVIGVNAKGKEGGISYAFSPAGKLVFTNSKRRNQNKFNIDLEEISKSKELINTLEQVRIKISQNIRREYE